MNKKLHDKYFLAFDDLHQKALQESQVHNKCLFCSKIPIIYVQIPSFVSAFGIHIQMIILVSVIPVEETFQTKYRIIRMFLTYSFNKVPTRIFLLVFVSNGTQVTSMRKKRDHKMAAWWTSDIFCSHSLPQQHSSLIIISIDGWHLMEPLGSATSFISQGDFIGDFACQYEFCYAHIQTVLETSECFLSNTNNTMQILSTMTEEQAVWYGHLSSKLLNTAPAAIKS